MRKKEKKEKYLERGEMKRLKMLDIKNERGMKE